MRVVKAIAGFLCAVLAGIFMVVLGPFFMAHECYTKDQWPTEGLNL